MPYKHRRKVAAELRPIYTAPNAEAAETEHGLVEERDAIARTWKALPDVERKVLELRFTSDLTQREIGERIGYSQMHVSRFIRDALSRMQDAAALAS